MKKINGATMAGAVNEQTDEEDIYLGENRARLLDEGALSYEEEGFMQGYDDSAPAEQNYEEEEDEDWESWDKNMSSGVF